VSLLIILSSVALIQGSSFGIATRSGWTVRGSDLGRASSSAPVHGAHPASCTIGTGPLSRG